MPLAHLVRSLAAPVVAAALATVLVATASPAGATEGQVPEGDVQRVVFVGNNWDGTATVLDPETFEQLGRLNIIPDYDERMMEIATNPERLAYFLAIREAIGEGNDQFVDDMYSSNDGRLIIVSRPSFADVVAIDLETQEIVWRFAVAGQRSDHMAISPDGEQVVVSASTGNVVHVLDVQTGEEVANFPSGGSPHENVFLDGGKKLIHASIGTVYTPGDDPVLDPAKGERVLEIVDTSTWKVVRRYNLRNKLDDRGLEDYSTAVRPMTISPDEKKIYFQVSFFHGFLEMDRASGKILRVKHLPNLVKDLPREQYVLDSAHHGIAMNPRGTKICVAGTMSDYATVVDAKTYQRSPLIKKEDGKPYWVTPSWDGKYCYISWSGTDEVAKISYRTEKVVQTVPVGDHPQRVRGAFVASELVAGLPNYVPE